jgi:hypothetical protein
MSKIKQLFEKILNYFNRYKKYLAIMASLVVIILLSLAYGEELSTQIDLSTGLQLLVGCVALGLGLVESKRWRTELIGRKQVELKLIIGRKAIELRRAFNFARPSFMGKMFWSEEEKSRRYQTLFDSLNKLPPLLWDAEVILPESSDKLNALYRTYSEKYSELLIAIGRLKDSGGSEATDKILMSQPDNDEFAKAIENTTDEILEIVRRL